MKIEQPPGSLADQAYEKLADMIERLVLKPGELITEKQLSELLGIGRMPIREAIKRLQNAHLIRIMPRRGMMVTEIKMEETFLQMEVRRALEAIIAKRAARLATPDEREEFLRLAVEYEEATARKDMDKSMKVDHEFNEFVAAVARNPFATSSIRPLHALARRMYYYSYMRDEELTVQINDGHCELMRAIAVGDEAEAERLSNHLMDLIERLYRKNYQQIMQ